MIALQGFYTCGKFLSVNNVYGAVMICTVENVGNTVLEMAAFALHVWLLKKIPPKLKRN